MIMLCRIGNRTSSVEYVKKSSREDLQRVMREDAVLKNSENRTRPTPIEDIAKKLKRHKRRRRRLEKKQEYGVRIRYGSMKLRERPKVMQQNN